jgi:hypothetical protein
MRETMKTALVPYTVEQMFELVEDFERYAQFVPWVTSSRLIERGTNVLVGLLEMHRGPVRETFATRTCSPARGRSRLRWSRGHSRHSRVDGRSSRSAIAAARSLFSCVSNSPTPCLTCCSRALSRRAAAISSMRSSHAPARCTARDDASLLRTGACGPLVQSRWPPQPFRSACSTYSIAVRAVSSRFAWLRFTPGRFPCLRRSTCSADHRSAEPRGMRSHPSPKGGGCCRQR